MSKENPKSRFKNKTPIPFHIGEYFLTYIFFFIISCTHTIIYVHVIKNILILSTGSINNVDEQISTKSNLTSNLEDRAHIKVNSIPSENEIVSSDEESEDEHGYVDRICGISKGIF